MAFISIVFIEFSLDSIGFQCIESFNLKAWLPLESIPFECDSLDSLDSVRLLGFQHLNLQRSVILSIRNY